MAKWIKNASGGDKTWVGQLVPDTEYYEIQSVEEKQWANNSVLLTDIGSGDAIVAKDDSGTLDITDVNDAINYLKDLDAKTVNVGTQPDPAPFAKPDYRTKLDATPTWVTCPENASTPIDFVLSSEKYVSGGEILFKDSKEGDYITAEVNDKDGVIPEAYRSATCENHPTVAEYVLKKWVFPVSGYSFYKLDTKPLNAKITPGLYLRVTYHATSEAGTRKIAVNYDLTKKLV